jgi:hypothetical protein
MTTHEPPETRVRTTNQDRPETAAGEKRTTDPATPGGAFESGELPETAGRRKPQPKINFLDLTQLVRSIQRSEGNPPCFSTTSTCDRLDCLWRSYCLGRSNTTS